MDFRIIEVDGHRILLERIEEDGIWQVYITMFLDLVDRYDEWLPFQTPEAAQLCIKEYAKASAWEFFERAKEWHGNIMT